jgi:AcrR family transcriptional regulator
MVECVIPLLKEYGSDVSTRRIAEACGVAEGTIFRAFGDKESLIAAAVERYFDPLPFRTAIRSIDPQLPVEEKLRIALGLLRERFNGIVGFMSAMRMSDGPPRSIRDAGGSWVDAFADALAPNAGELAVPLETVAHYLRLLAIATAIPPLAAAHEFSEDELLGLVLTGVLSEKGGRPCSADC